MNQQQLVPYSRDLPAPLKSRLQQLMNQMASQSIPFQFGEEEIVNHLRNNSLKLSQSLPFYRSLPDFDLSLEFGKQIINQIRNSFEWSQGGGNRSVAFNSGWMVRPPLRGIGSSGMSVRDHVVPQGNPVTIRTSDDDAILMAELISPSLGEWNEQLESFGRVIPSPEFQTIIGAFDGSVCRCGCSEIESDPLIEGLKSLVEKEVTETSLECGICHENFKHPVAGECGHVFCASCLLGWISFDRSCPRCRVEIHKLITLFI